MCLGLPFLWPTFAAAGWQSFTEADGLAARRASSILVDRSGRYWFGADGVGR